MIAFFSVRRWPPSPSSGFMSFAPGRQDMLFREPLILLSGAPTCMWRRFTNPSAALNLTFLSNQRPRPAPIRFLLTNKAARSYNTAQLKAIIRGGRLHFIKGQPDKRSCPFKFSIKVWQNSSFVSLLFQQLTAAQLQHLLEKPLDGLTPPKVTFYKTRFEVAFNSFSDARASFLLVCAILIIE